MTEGKLGFLLLAGALISGLVGWMLLKSKDRGGPVGWIIATILRLEGPKTPNTAVSSTAAGRIERECPFCAELILSKARVCKHCGRDVEPLPVEAVGTSEEDPRSSHVRKE